MSGPIPPTFRQVFNLRDLGGLPTADGGRVRAGRLFRSDSPHRATTEDLDRLRDLGLRMVIDLREASEREQFGIVAADVAARHAHLPVFDVGGPRPGSGQEHLRDAMLDAARRHGRAGEYLYMLEHGHATFVGALESLATPDHLPALFHCAVGKDRTGVLAALVLTLVGVPADEVAADYARTEPGMLALVDWAVEHEPDYGDELRTAAPTAGPWTTPAVMASFLDLVAQRHGSVAGFLREVGMPADVPGRLRDLLLEG